MSRLDDAKRVLSHYFRRAGVPNDLDASTEIEGIVDDIVAAALEASSDRFAALEARVQALEAGRPTVLSVEGPDQIAALRDALRPIVEASYAADSDDERRARVRALCAKLDPDNADGGDLVEEVTDRHIVRYGDMLRAAVHNPSAFNVPELQDLLGLWCNIRIAKHRIDALNTRQLAELEDALVDECDDNLPSHGAV